VGASWAPPVGHQTCFPCELTTDRRCKDTAAFCAHSRTASQAVPGTVLGSRNGVKSKAFAN
jgi:hypothetical protein